MPQLNQHALLGLGVLGVGLAAAALVVAIVALTLDGGGEDAPSHANGPAYTVWLVEEAVAHYEAEGREAAIARHGSPESVDGPWYVFVIDAQSGVLLGHFDPDLVGQSLRTDPLGTDVTAVPDRPTPHDAVEAVPEPVRVPVVVRLPQARRGDVDVVVGRPDVPR